MGRGSAAVLTGVLALCILALLLGQSGRSSGRGTVFAGLLAMGLLWTVVIAKGMPAGLKTTLLVAVGLLTVLAVVPRGAGSALSAWFDRGRVEAPLLMGSGSSRRSVAVVYHPGGSDFPRRVAVGLGESLVERGYSVAVLTAGRGTPFDPEEYDALVLGSPVYLGETRPALEEFLSAHAPVSVPAFALLSGWAATSGKQDLVALSALIRRAGGNLRGGAKLATGSSPTVLAQGIASLADTIDGSLRRNCRP